MMNGTGNCIGCRKDMAHRRRGRKEKRSQLVNGRLKCTKEKY